MNHQRTVIAIALCLLHAGASAQDIFIPAAGRVDMVHDAQRGMVYISEGGSILRFDLSAGAHLPSISVGSDLGGMDLSPDGNTLAVADRVADASSVYVHLLDLSDLSVDTHAVPKAFYESGTWTVAYTADGSLLTTSRFAGSGWVPMRRLDPSTSTWRTLASVRQDTMLTPSAEGLNVAFAESNTSGGAWGQYDVVADAVVSRSGYTDGTSWFNFEIGVAPNGGQFAIPTYGGTHVYDANYQKIALIGTYAGPQPIAATYHPVESLVYFPWSGSQQVKVYDTSTLTEVDSYYLDESFVHTGNRAFRQGRTKLSRDGSLLMVTGTGGIHVIQQYAPLSASDVSATTPFGAPVSISLPGTIGNGGTLQYAIAEGPSNGQAHLSGNILHYTPATNFSGTDHVGYSVSYGNAVARSTVELNVQPPENRAPLAVDDAATTRNTAIRIPVLNNDSDPDGDTLRITAVTVPSQGSVRIENDQLVFSPPKGFKGSASFRYTISDGNGGTATADVVIIRR